MMRSRLTLYLAIFGLWCGAANAVERRVAVFEFELIDTSLATSTTALLAEEQARLHLISDQLRQRLAASGHFSVVDIAPVAAEAQANNLHGCNGCDAGFAKRLGADLAITGLVRKVSMLILSMSLHVREASSGRVIAVVNADFRGTTDESWSRALDWLVRNRLLVAGSGILP